jgi:hypothetical protein
MACLKFGSLPPAINPDNLTSAELAATRENVAGGPETDEKGGEETQQGLESAGKGIYRTATWDPQKRKPTLKSPGAPRSEKANRGDTMAEGVWLDIDRFFILLRYPLFTQALKRTFD